MLELVIRCPKDNAECLSDQLFEMGSLAVTIEDADSDSEREQPLFGEPGMEIEQTAWNENLIIALWPDEVDQAAVQAVLSAYTYTWRPVPEEDWVRVTQSQFDPLLIGERIWIVPSWHEDFKPQSEALTLHLDPGLAFGTGSHPTTRLCAMWLEQHVQAGQSVLDYGCGSGILAMIAAKLGANPVVGTDIDEQAITSTQYNATVNQVAIQAGLPATIAVQPFDIVVANILANPLMTLAPTLAQYLHRGSHLVLSGILVHQVQDIQQAYAPYISLTVWQEVDEWVCMTGQVK